MTNAEKLLNALNEIDDSYLLEVDKRICTVRTRRRATFTSIAAMFVAVVMVIVFVTTSGHIPNAPNNNQIITNTDNNTDDYTDNELEFNTENKTGAIDQYDFEDNDDTQNSGSSAGCSRGITGVAIDGIFYYQIPYDGIYRYTQGESTKMLVKEKDPRYYDYIVNDLGLYYMTDNTSIYFISNDSDKATLFYEDKKINYFSMSRHNSTDLLLEINYSSDAFGHDKSIIVDGKTGEEKCVAYECKSHYDGALEDKLIEQGYSYEEASDKAFICDEYFADEIIYALGDRALKATPTSSRSPFGYCTYTLNENEEQLLHGSEIIYELSPEIVDKDYIIFRIGENDTDEVSLDYYIARANGEDTKLKACSAIPAQGNSDYLYYIDYDDNLIYVDAHTGESKVLTHKKDLSYKEMYSDGKYIYFEEKLYSDDGDETLIIECYEIVFDENGVPSDLKLIDENIIE